MSRLERGLVVGFLGMLVTAGAVAWHDQAAGRMVALTTEEMQAVRGEGLHPCVYNGRCDDNSRLDDVCLECSNVLDARWDHCCNKSSDPNSDCDTTDPAVEDCPLQYSYVALAGPGTPGSCTTPCTLVGNRIQGTCVRWEATGNDCPIP